MSEYDDAVDHTDDDLADWADDELVKALRAPGLDDELTEEQRFLAAFRETAGAAAGTSGSGRRPTAISARRLGAGGTAVVVAVALSGGVAAAYTGNLPDPVQQLAHTVIGAPAPQPETPLAKSGADGDGRPGPSSSSDTGSSGPALPSSTPSPSPTPGPASPGGGGRTSRPSDGRSSKPAAGGPSSSPSASPSDSPTPAPDPPAAVTMSAASHLVDYGTTMSLVGHLTTADGTPVAGHRIALLMHDSDGWSVVVKTTTDDAGDVVTLSRPVTGLQHYRWRVRGHVRSEGWRVRVHSTIAASAELGSRVTTIRASAVGAHAGDRVELYRWLGGQPTMVGRAAVNDAGEVSFEVPTPKRRKVFVVRLLATADHTAARAKAVVRLPKAEPTPESASG